MLRTAKLQVGAALFSLVAVTGVVARSSSAAFSATTNNTGSSLAAGDVAISDDDGATAMFSLTNLKPGSTATRCINVSYAGSLNAVVKLYGAVGGGTGLADYLDLEVDRGTGATGGTGFDCTGFTPGTSVWTTATNGDLGTFMSTKTSYASGADAWSVTGGAPADVGSYRFTVTVQDNNAATGLTATSVSFTWEAQNS